MRGERVRVRDLRRPWAYSVCGKRGLRFRSGRNLAVSESWYRHLYDLSEKDRPRQMYLLQRRNRSNCDAKPIDSDSTGGQTGRCHSDRALAKRRWRYYWHENAVRAGRLGSWTTDFPSLSVSVPCGTEE